MNSTLNGHYRNGALRAGVERLLDRLHEPRTLEALNASSITPSCRHVRRYRSMVWCAGDRHGGASAPTP